jgi:hypothetical protein
MTARLLERERGRARRVPGPLAVHPDRRVPGHQRAQFQIASLLAGEGRPRTRPRGAARRRPRRSRRRRDRRAQHLRRGRSRPGDLRLARRRHHQHPRVRDPLPRRQDDHAGRELPLDRAHPRRSPTRSSSTTPTARTSRSTRRGPRAATPAQVVLCRDERHEAELVADWFRLEHDDNGVAWRDMAVFYRTNALSRVMEDALRTAGSPTPSPGARRSTTARRSRTPSRTCASSPTGGRRLARCASSTPRRAGSARPASTASALAEAARGSRSSRRCARPPTRGDHGPAPRTR